MQALAQHVAQLWRIRMSVHGDSMLCGCFQQLGFSVGCYGDSAVSFARKFAAIDVFATHGDLPAEC